MDDNKLPVYLDCNYEELERYVKELNNLKEEANNTFHNSGNDVLGLIDWNLKDGLNTSPFNDVECIYMLINRLSSTVSSTIEKVRGCDEKSREKLREFVNRVLSYTKPIDRNKYSHLTDEEIEEVYSFCLKYENGFNTSNFTSIIDKYLNAGDNEVVVELTKLGLSLCSGLWLVNYSNLSTGYKLGTEEDQKEILDLLDDDVTLNVYINRDYNFFLYKDSFIELNKILLSDSRYDEKTLLCIYGGMTSRKNNWDNMIGNESLVTLKFGDLEKEVSVNDLYYYCSNDSFNYCKFLKKTIFDNNVSGNTNVFFNLNGVDVNTNVDKLREAITLLGVEDEKESNSSGVSLLISTGVRPYDHVDTQLLDFTKTLIDLDVFSEEELAMERDINILGKKACISLKNLSNCYTNGSFDVDRLLVYGGLSESSYVYFNNYANRELSLSDLNIVASSDAYQFFSEHGGVDQSGITDLIRGGYVKDYEDLIEFASSKYGMTEDDVYIIMKSMDGYQGVGACSYADTCNIIYELYDFNEEKFQRDFGYPMLNEYGRLNGNQLLLDLYIYTNIGNRDEQSLLVNNDGKIEINPDLLDGYGYIDSNNQKYYGYGDDYLEGIDTLSDFLSSNGNHELDNYTIKTIKKNDGLVNNHQEVVDAINNKNAMSMDLYYNWDMYAINSTSSGRYNIGHAVTPVAATEEGVLVMSWGDLYYIPLENVDVCNIFERTSNPQTEGGCILIYAGPSE